MVHFGHGKRSGVVWLMTMLVVCGLAAIEIDVDFPGVEQVADDQGNPIWQVYAGESFKFRCSLSAQAGFPGKPRIEGIENFHAIGQQDFSELVGGGQAKRVLILQLVAEKPGITKIGPISARSGSEEARTGTYYINVLPARQQQQKPPQATPSRGHGTPKAASLLLECDLVVPRTEVFVGEAVNVSLKIYKLGPVHQFGIESRGNLDQFGLKESAPPSVGHEERHGRQVPFEERFYTIYPTTPGPLTLGPVTVAYIAFENDQTIDFFGHQIRMGGVPRRYSTQSNPVLLSVKPLPKERDNVDVIGEVDGFEVRLDRTQAAANEPISLTLTVSGRLDLASIPEPKLQLPADWKCFKSRVTTDVDKSRPGGVGGKKKFEFILQIPRGGQHVIPAQTLNYFDTTTGTVQVLRSDPIALSITGESKPVSLPTQSASQEAHSQGAEELQDVHHLHEHEQSHAPGALPWWLFFLIFFLPVGIFWRKGLEVVLPWVGRQQLRRSKSQDVMSKELAIIVEDGRLEELRGFFTRACAARFAVEPYQLDEILMRQSLASIGWSLEKIQEFFDFLDECASIAFVRATRTPLQQDVAKKARYWFLLLYNK